MRRQSLRITIVLGVLVTLVGGTGIFAAFSDRATAGQNAVVSGARAHAADLLIEGGGILPGTTAINCDANLDGIFGTDNTNDPQFTSNGLQPGESLTPAYVCLFNVGASGLAVTASAIDLIDLDVGCTGDEAETDNDCGVFGGTPGVGELSPLLVVDIDQVDCDQPAVILWDGLADSLNAFVDEPIGLFGTTLASHATMCLALHLSYPTPVSESIAQLAQSDQATWRFAFDGTAN